LAGGEGGEPAGGAAAVGELSAVEGDEGRVDAEAAQVNDVAVGDAVLAMVGEGELVIGGEEDEGDEAAADVGRARRRVDEFAGLGGECDDGGRPVVVETAARAIGRRVAPARFEASRPLRRGAAGSVAPA